jgi:hypothetical protein
MATSPSDAFLRMRAFIAERMLMSLINQPLILKELLRRSNMAPACENACRILLEDVTQIETYTASPPMAMAASGGWAAKS